MNPLLLFFILLLGLPTLELYVLIQVGGEIGAFATVMLVVFTAVLGTYLMRRQGMGTLLRVRQALDRGEMPALEMLEGAMLLLGGLLLLIPGFVTDALGFLCLLPAFRRLLLLGLVDKVKMRAGAVRPQSGAEAADRVIEGEFRREKD